MTSGELDRLVEWVRREDRPEMRDGLLVPGAVANRPAFGPNVPALGWPMNRHPGSGLVLPSKPSLSPLDLMGRFATAEDAAGRTFPVEQLEELLREFPLRATIGLLGRLNCALEVRSLSDADLQEQVVSAFCPPPWRPRILGLVRNRERVFTSPHVILLLARLALHRSPDREGDVRPDAAGAALLVMADHVMASAHPGDPAFDLDLARNGLFYARDEPKMLWGRYERIWREIAPTMAGRRPFFNVSRLVEEVAGMSIDQYMALAAVLYLKYFGLAHDEGAAEGYWTPRQFGELAIDQEAVRRFVASWSEDRDWFVAAITSSPFVWDFTPFRRRPLLRHGPDVAPFSAQFLLEKGTDGIYYTVMDHLRDGGGSVTEWTTFFGYLWQEYVSTLLDEAIPDRSRVVSEDELLARQGEGRVCDRVVVYPGEWVLIEAVSKRITLPSTATGNWEDLERDLALAVAVKARQLSGTVERLIADPEAGRVPHGTRMRFRPLVVLPGPFPNVPTIIDKLRESIRVDSQCKALMRPEVGPVVVMDANDYELLLGSAESAGRSVLELLREWQESGLAKMSFWNWMTSERRSAAAWPKALGDAAERVLDRAEAIFRPKMDGESPPTPG